jgi:hypothetical protein
MVAGSYVPWWQALGTDCEIGLDMVDANNSRVATLFTYEKNTGTMAPLPRFQRSP